MPLHSKAPVAMPFPWLRLLLGPFWGPPVGTELGLLCPQAKYLAQIIVMGVQVVGRAFARALRQEFAGKCGPPSCLLL